MAGQLRAKLQERGFTTHYGMGETAGNAVDLIGGAADGVYAVGAGARGVAALNDGGDGCMTFDALVSEIAVPDKAAIQDIWLGPGSSFHICRANSIGEGSFGRIWNKGTSGVNANQIQALDGSGGFYRQDFIGQWNGSLGRWRTTDQIFPFGAVVIVIQILDATSDANVPTWFVWDATQHRTLTVGSGLTTTNDPTGAGAWDSEVGEELVIGNRPTNDRTWDGEIDELAWKNDGMISEAQAQELINLALTEIGGAPGGQLGGIGQMAGNAPHSFRTRMVGI